MFRNKILFLILLASACSCSKTESAERADDSPYIEDNRWIYSQMNRNYLLREDLPDSLSCDYTLSPDVFFRKLLSSRDRFSYCEFNGNYKPDNTKANQSVETVYIYKADDYAGKRVGYLHYYGFGAASDLVPALRYFYEQKIDELILDLRFNNGGYVSTCRYLCNCIVPEIGYGDVFQYNSYNDILSAEYERKTGSRFTFEYFEKASESVESLGTPVIGLRMKRLFVLVSGKTASASEALIVCLKPYMPVITIGENTTGKGTGMHTLQDNGKCRYILNPLTMRYHGKDGGITPDTGIVPDYYVKNEDSGVSDERMGKLVEPLYAKAVELITANQ